MQRLDTPFPLLNCSQWSLPLLVLNMIPNIIFIWECDVIFTNTNLTHLPCRCLLMSFYLPHNNLQCSLESQGTNLGKNVCVCVHVSFKSIVNSLFKVVCLFKLCEPGQCWLISRVLLAQDLSCNPLVIMIIIIMATGRNQYTDGKGCNGKKRINDEKPRFRDVELVAKQKVTTCRNLHLHLTHY